MANQEVRIPKFYEVDWTKVKTFEQLKLVLSILTITISDGAPDFQQVKPYLKEVE